MQFYQARIVLRYQYNQKKDRQYNDQTKREKYKAKNIHKTLHRKLTIEQHESH